MHQLTFPITADGLALDVRIHLDSATLARRQILGQPFQSSIEGKGLIDTGSDITVVAPPILRQLGLASGAQSKTLGIGGSIPVQLFTVTLFVLLSANPTLPWLIRTDLIVMEMSAALPVDVLIGMDVIRTCKLLVDGPAGTFALDF